MSSSYGRLAAIRDYWMPRDESARSEVKVSDIDAVLNEVKRLTEMAMELRAERDALKADAERYRWLRDHPTQWSWNPDPNAYKGKVVGFTGRDTRYCDSTLEAAIDAAMRP